MESLPSASCAAEGLREDTTKTTEPSQEKMPPPASPAGGDKKELYLSTAVSNVQSSLYINSSSSREAGCNKHISTVPHMKRLAKGTGQDAAALQTVTRDHLSYKRMRFK